MRVAIAQTSPVFLDRAATVEKAAHWADRAGQRGCALVAFGETFVPAYPVWVERLEGAVFDSALQKDWHARYLEQAVDIDRGDLNPLREVARARAITVVIGVAEKPRERAGHSVYASCVVIDARGEIASVHRKLMPTYEERLSWAIGDGAGLVTHELGPFRLGALNCWENWMPLARAALHAQGETLHVAIWPGSDRTTADITRFIAREGRSFVVSASSLIRESDVPTGLPGRERLARPGEWLQNGGSCIAGPDGRFVVEPVVGEERLLEAELDPSVVRRERQNFDPSGHYARPDVLRLTVDRRRQAPARFIDDEPAH